MRATVAEADVAAWSRCGSCTALVYGKRLARNLYVCPECGHHDRLTAAQRIDQLLDPGSFRPLLVEPVHFDILGFTDTRPYAQRWEAARRETALAEAVLCGAGAIGGHGLVVAVMDFRFLGGSLGSAVGEMITLAVELAVDEALPLLVVSTSGGARMQEGCLSLMQMAKTGIAVERHREHGLLSISLVTDPTYGGVAASFATNTDVIVAESGSRMGFAGPRVIRQTIGQELPAEFQSSGFLASKGQVDIVADRTDLRTVLGRLLAVGRREQRDIDPSTDLPADLPAGEPADEPARQPVGTPAGRPVPAGSGVLITDPERLVQRDPWETVRLARDSGRPTVRDYLARSFDSFIELRGDRLYGDCSAVVAGIAEIDGLAVAVVGTEKGHSTTELVAHNFGMPQPEGYRKAMRVMSLAARLGLPVVTLIDTPGAYPGREAEERGQASAIAHAIQRMSALSTPVIAVITGEGGSGGALALAVADRVLVAENGVFSVISPEACSSILWNDTQAAAEAARALGLNAPWLLRLGIVDAVVPEPLGGSQTDHLAAGNLLRQAVLEALRPLLALPAAHLIRARRSRFRRFGQAAVTTPTDIAPPQPRERHEEKAV
ncbi:acetyl-CoA carboxylase carboxyltransferase subunit alpha/beta [Protofrankia sp. BMG5.30]|uniref:acetyl-CoA carboxylase carboxyltransferase subunit alpha/beta n=3 Tax=Protofrankia TaxID=2994361 RepID=UPI000977200C|nr:acetyl-CoA carboxylase carboxyltransferase subunit alpha/beta [Protofrankia sp. BMG5.30]ONH35503.1 acetyl-CoA carboxyl transferase [Protofrankia sp. BMG5.30]